MVLTTLGNIPPQQRHVKGVKGKFMIFLKIFQKKDDTLIPPDENTGGNVRLVPSNRFFCRRIALGDRRSSTDFGDDRHPAGGPWDISQHLHPLMLAKYFDYAIISFHLSVQYYPIKIFGVSFINRGYHASPDRR